MRLKFWYKYLKATNVKTNKIAYVCLWTKSIYSVFLNLHKLFSKLYFIFILILFVFKFA